MWIRKMLQADSISTARFVFELCGGRFVMLLIVAWFVVQLADLPAVNAAGSERLLQNVERKGKRG